MSIRILLAPTLELARAAASEHHPALTVEAEYGSVVIEGRRFTAAHHQPRGSEWVGRHLVPHGQPSPCCNEGIPALADGDAVLVSHLDLDTIGGCLRAQVFSVMFTPGNEARRFWRLAEWVDTRGPHHLDRAPEADAETVARLHAYWAWSKANTRRWPRDAISDVTEEVAAAEEALIKIFADDAELLAAGAAFAAAEEELNERTFAHFERGVIVRIAREQRDFCNHLYRPPVEMLDGEPDPYHPPGLARAVACLNTATGAVTISLADPIPGVSCRAIVQALWGPAAGGHDGIAGSPRGRVMTEQSLRDAVEMLAEAIRADGQAGEA